MSLLHALGHRLRVLFTPRSYDQELDEGHASRGLSFGSLKLHRFNPAST